ncbi:MAG TPA: Ig-like domain-containing protein, partial [Polyangiales bacterium]|nr:Ig-like domain-containing protein [Polyangiales bacterium]
RIVQEVLPANGAKGVPRNGAIQVQLAFVYPEERVTSTWEHTGVRLVRVDDGVEVMGVLDTTHFHSMQRVTWAPLTLLAANTEYRVEVTSMPEHRSDIEGKTTSITTFRTSDDVAPELELTGELQVALRAEWVPVQECWMCGCGPSAEKRPALMVDFTLPQVSGGFADYGYTAWVGYTYREPLVFDGPGSGMSRFDVHGEYLALAPGAQDVVTIEVEHFTSCLSFNAWDAAGQAKSAESICVTQSEVDAILATLDTAADSGTTPEVDGGAEHAADSGVVDDEDAGQPRSADASTFRHAKANSRKQLSPSAAGCAVGTGSAAPSMLMAALILGVRRRGKLR